MPSPVLSLYDVLVEEYESQELQPPAPRAELAARRRQHVIETLAAAGELDPDGFDRKIAAAMVKELYSWLHANGVRRSALCFSGGGIRSATFGLGVVQGLARHGLLKRFDFLSTVSGGGYLGSWLSSWIDRVRRQPPEAADRRSPVEVVEDQLRHLPTSPLDPEPAPVRYLRSYSRYMSPKLGLLSADTWTLVAIFLRNLLLNWFVLLPLMAALLIVPRVSVIFVRLGTRDWFYAQEGWSLRATLCLAAALGAAAIAYIVVNRPSLDGRSRLERRYRGQGWFLGCCLLPLALMAVLLTLYWAWAHIAPPGQTPFALQPGERIDWRHFVLFGLLLHGIGFLLSRYWVREFFDRKTLGEIAIVAFTGLLGGYLAWHAFQIFLEIGPGLSSEIYVCFAAPLVLLVFLLAATLFVGMASYYTSDADREWLARAGAWVLIALVVRCALSIIVIFGPDALLLHSLPVKSLLDSLGGASGLVTLLLGRSARTPAQKTPSQPGGQEPAASLADRALSLAAPVFAVFVLIALSGGTALLVRWVAETFDHYHFWGLRIKLPYESSWPTDIIYYSPWWAIAIVFTALVAVGRFMGRYIDINRFSLHSAYRDRLIRAYMGASRGSDRRPDPFTGFDDGDNVQMHNLRGNRPFHVVNMALNLVGGSNLAWQDRKAESFTASPLHAGNYGLGYRDSAEYALHKDGKSALSLGTSMAISGAAASPNMGYHSSPVVTFLLALFNVRLGWWLGNPGRAGDKTYDTQGPPFAPRSLFAEAFGFTDSEHPYVYLTDGGHFENLGLYEMILRRCHFIVVSDGGQDPDFTFEDLGNAVSKIRVDLGVPIDFEKILIRPRPKHPDIYDVTAKRAASQPYCALARIRYACVDGAAEDGLLLYVKPSLNGTEPADVFHYSRLHPSFPHESTANQLYTESQFESYRELGVARDGVRPRQAAPGGLDRRSLRADRKGPGLTAGLLGRMIGPAYWISLLDRFTGSARRGRRRGRRP